MENYYEFARPYLKDLLTKLKLNKIYLKGEGNYIFYKNKNNDEKKVLDFIGGYGSLLLGHHHPEIQQYAKKLLEEKLTIHSQLSQKHYAGKLAKSLSDIIAKYTGKSYITTFSNSGAEAVEAAIKHMRLIYNRKITNQLDRISKELHSISNYFSKSEKHFIVNVEGSLFSSYSEFKKYIFSINKNQINNNSPFLLAAKKSFHGKTTGALDITYNEEFRSVFQLIDSDSKKANFFSENKEEINEIINQSYFELKIPGLSPKGEIYFQKVKISSCLGIIIEPIQGEGGVNEINQEFLSYLREKANELKIPLVFDEIQCGFYRTGSLFHSMKLKVFADYYLLGKSLGGGLVKNAALIIDKEIYDEEFGLVHTSTFAEDEYTCAISLKALEVSKNYSEKVDEISNYFFQKLHQLKNECPEVINEIRGDGLMMGITFYDFDDSNNYSFQMISRTGYLNYFTASYLLDNWDIRVAPTLSDKFTLRLQPSVLTTKEEIDYFIEAIRSLCQILYYRDFYKFIEHLLPEKERGLRPLEDFGRDVVPFEISLGLKTVGFITHYINEKGARKGDESLELLSDDAINNLLYDVLPIASPIILGSKVIKSISGKRVNAYFIGLLFTANMARKAMMNDHLEEYIDLCQKAVNLAQKELSCQIVGLGQYTSVITKNGKELSNPDIHLTTGNSFTVNIGLEAIKGEIKELARDDSHLTLAVLGASGNISSVYCKCLAPLCSEILLKGSDSNLGIHKIKRFARELLGTIINLILDEEEAINPHLKSIIESTETFKRIQNKKSDVSDYNLFDLLEKELGTKMPIKIIENLNELKTSLITVVATNSPHAFLKPEHFSPHSIVYDISVPINCTNELIENTKNIKVILGGIVDLPFNEKLPMKGYPLDKGEAFACISETILLGMEDFDGNFSYGNLTPKQINWIRKVGEKHGFKLKKPKLEEIF